MASNGFKKLMLGMEELGHELNQGDEYFDLLYSYIDEEDLHDTSSNINEASENIQYNEAIDDKIELEYDNLKFTQSGNQRDVDDWDEWDREADWTLEIDRDDLYTFLYEAALVEDDFPRAYEDDFDPNNSENWKEFTDWLDDNFDEIFDKYRDRIMDHYEEDAIEDAELNYDPDDYIDWDSMPGGHDDYDLDEALYSSDKEYVAKECSYEMAEEIAQKAKKVLKLPSHEVEMLEHDINNLRSNEWVDIFARLSDRSEVKKLFFKYAVEEEILDEAVENDSEKICCICNEPYEGYGNNAEPVCSGTCCDKCNIERVIPMRFKMMRESKELNEEKIEDTLLETDEFGNDEIEVNCDGEDCAELITVSIDAEGPHYCSKCAPKYMKQENESLNEEIISDYVLICFNHFSPDDLRVIHGSKEDLETINDDMVEYSEIIPMTDKLLWIENNDEQLTVSNTNFNSIDEFRNAVEAEIQKNIDAGNNEFNILDLTSFYIDEDSEGLSAQELTDRFMDWIDDSFVDGDSNSVIYLIKGNELDDQFISYSSVEEFMTRDAIDESLNEEKNSEKLFRKFPELRKPVTEEVEEVITEDLSDGTYKITYYLATATRERRPETREDIDNDYRVDTIHAAGDFEAMREAFRIQREIDESDIDFEMEDYDIESVDDFIRYFNEDTDWGDGSILMLKVEGPNGVIYDTGYNKDTFIKELDDTLEYQKKMIADMEEIDPATASDWKKLFGIKEEFNLECADCEEEILEDVDDDYNFDEMDEMLTEDAEIKRFRHIYGVE